MHLIDTHAHLGYLEDLDSCLAHAKAAGIQTILNICTGLSFLQQGLKLAQAHPGFIYNAAGVHPHDAEKESTFFETLSQHTSELVAIGETGLDYYYQNAPHATQKQMLRKQLQLAKRTSLPVIIHCRDAFADLFTILDEEHFNIPSVLHCFTGTLSEAQEVIRRGWYISFSGIVTFKKSEQLRQVLQQMPLDRILIETDAPYLAPQSHRGKPNEPAYVAETAATVAQVKGLSLEQLAAFTTANAKQLFRL